MNVCTRCGATNQPASKFCLSCGNPLAAAAAPPPAYGPPQPAPPAPSPAAGWGPVPSLPNAPPHAAPGAAPPQAWPPPPPPPAWQQPGSEQSAFTAAPAGAFPPSGDRARFGAPEGMNPFGATVGPDFGSTPGGAPPAYAPPPPAYAPPPQGYAPPPAYAPPQAYAPPPQPGYGAPPGQHLSPPQQAAPPHAGYAPPASAYAPPPAYSPPPAAQAYGAPAPPQWAPPPPPAQPPQPSHDPSAFAATAPPPNTDDHDAQVQRSVPGAGASPPAPASPPNGLAGRDPEHVEAGAIRVLAGFLISYDQSEFGVFWPLYQGQNVLGRKAAAAGLDIEIDSPTTSSRHAVVYASARPGRLKVEDAGSTNGTFLNDAQLDRGKKFELRDGDTLRFGGFNVTVKII